jgi:glyoxylase-like metal-dependent hydrolase (beta-lactamase superfamily II)
MTDQPIKLTRRAALSGAAALPLSSVLAGQAQAAAPMLGPDSATYKRFALGAFEVTTILAATSSMANPQNIFALNVSPEDFATASEAAFIPANRVQFFFTPTVVNTGSELILFDTGLSAKGTTAALAAAGYTAGQIDLVVITHMHGDHIGGLKSGDTETFPNARYITGAVEYDAWDMSGNSTFETKMRPLAGRTEFIEGGASVAGGITAIEAFGHTPGHMTYMLESQGKQLLLAADTANHYIWSLANPDWEMRYDRDKSAAAATRRKIFGMLAADRVPMVGYHMPWPGIGYIETRGNGFNFVPHSYQMLL